MRVSRERHLVLKMKHSAAKADGTTPADPPRPRGAPTGKPGGMVPVACILILYAVHHSPIMSADSPITLKQALTELKAHAPVCSGADACMDPNIKNMTEAGN